MAEKTSQSDPAYAEALKRIDACLKQGKKGTWLDLKGLGLKSVPPEIGQHTALTGLYLDNNQLTALPPEIGQLTALTELNLHDNQLTALPPEIGQLTALTRMFLHKNQLTALPPEIGQLTALTTLELSENHLTALSPEIGQLTALNELYLRDNQLTALPPEIGQLTALTKLFLHDNQLTALPSSIGHLAALTQLYLQFNHLTALSPEIGRLNALTELRLHDNQLTALPPEIGQLTVLTNLYLSNNQLTALPPEIGQLTALTVLGLRSNQLTALPPEIGQLTALTVLGLRSNQLTALPPEIGQLTALTTLELSENQLTALPPEIGQPTALIGLYLHKNPGLGLPDSILGPGFNEVSSRRGTPARPADILNFYFSQQRAADTGLLRSLNEIKVMLVGDGGAGKTSLRRFFTGKKHSKKEPETLGIVLDTFTLRCGQTDIAVRLWDFAGQDITHALHQFFLTEGCVYLVVVESRSDNEQSDAERWLKLIARYGKGAPALVVLNKQDMRKPDGYDLDRNPLCEQFPFIRGFQPTTCGTVRRGCQELLEKLRAVVSSMPEATLGVSESWIEVKDECFKQHREWEKRHYLSLEEFRALCARHGETDREKQESLARILHKLGAVLHFIDEPRLRDTTVLDPHWVTDGAYRILRCQDVPGSRGIVTVADAAGAVPGADEAAARYLLGLMERFEMCFPLEDADPARPAERWLVPGSLDKNQPDAIRADDWKAPDRIRLLYTYNPLQEGVIPRFIVMSHPLSEKQSRWRNGVVLEDAGARALIRKSPKTVNALEVIVQGPAAAREKLVKVVRGYLARIHRELPEPGPKEEQELSGTNDDLREVRQMRAEERRGVPIVVETPAGDVVKSATEELNRSSDQAPRTEKKRPLRVFLSYSHDDRNKQLHFRKNLMSLESDGYITFWDDPNIKPDMDWRPEIERELETMDVFVGLMTTNFVSSKFIERVEFKRALERRKDKTAKMWLILVDDRRIEGTKYEGIQVLKPGGKAVSKHKNLRAGFDAVEKELHTLIVDHWKSLPNMEERM